MTQTQEIKIQPQGLWIEKKWLEKAGLNNELQLVIQEGEIRILSASLTDNKKQEAAWDVFLSLEKDAPSSEMTDVSTNHDNYLYQK